MDPSWKPTVVQMEPNGSADQYTANNIFSPVDFIQYMPDCSETGPPTLAEVSVPNWIRQYIIQLCENDMEKITKKLPHIGIIFTKKGNNIVLNGPPKQVQVAKKFLYDLTASVQSTTVVVDVHVKREFHRHIIGKQGATINWIRKETCTAIYLRSHGKRFGMALPPDVIRIEGYLPRVAAAKEKILRIVTKVERFSTMTDPYEEMADDPDTETYHEVHHLDRNISRHVIGRSGATAMKIQRTTGTWINVTDVSADDSAVLIIGKKENVVKARKMITDIEDKMTIVENRLLSETSVPDDLETRQEEGKLPSHYETVNVNPRLFSRVIGRNCATITNLAEKHDVQILLPNRRERVSHNASSVTIVSSASKAKAAKDDLDELIKEIETQITESVKIDRSVYHHLIGYRGRKIFEVQDQFDVSIWFPRREKQTDLVVIHGRKENVENAKRRLLFLENYFMQVEVAKLERFCHARSLCLRGFPDSRDRVRSSYTC